MNIPEQLKTNILNMHGNRGKEWLDSLPILLSSCERNLQIKIFDCYPDANFNYAAPALLNGTREIVFKCSIPNESLTQEAAALRHYNGEGCVQLIHFDDKTGVMLLEKAIPGKLLEEHQGTDEESCIFAVEVMHRLHKPLQENCHFQALNDWLMGFDQLRMQFSGQTGPFPRGLIDTAQGISNELLQSMSKKVLLHGDLHYANILSSNKNGWIAIDPKGVIGEPEFEIPLPRLGNNVNLSDIQRNVDLFIEISGFDRQRITHWLFVKAVLAAWWSYEDTGNIWMPFIQCAEAVKKIYRI